ncbi:uncharacterized protein LOC110899795 isoform X2 [Helianthus annuus]|uniref:uncharacterized protein LOC110899795 isoform X2 n=1 Tax=Helianthus annuus TaxID=4232 RepID=UPI000B901F43|nr:uncharacterized protein LOC110899795 isoform X2 [Helianthus annuus]
MMAQPSHDAHVIGPQFVVPYQINVVVNRCPTGYLEITDIQNNIMFTIRSCNTPLHCQRLMRDGRGTPIAMLRAKMRLAQPPERFMVTISPNVDYAFVVALIGTIDAMKSSGSIKAAAHVAVGIATGAVRYISGVGPP